VIALSRERGVLIAAIAPGCLRAVFHLDVDASRMRVAAETLSHAIAAACAPA
jgi:hypothetical protein